MKLKVAIVVLIVACVGLGIAIFATKKQADVLHTTDVGIIDDYSNQVVAADKQIKELGQVNLTLSNDLAVAQAEIVSNGNQMSQLSNSLAAVSATLADTRNSLVSAQEMVTNLNARIAELEVQKQDLDDQATVLSNKLAQLSEQIENTRYLLAVSRTNNSYLQSELQKQLAQKADLEHKFNDIDELRAQVKKIKDEMFVARRIELDKNDLGDRKGASLLMSRNTPPSKSEAGKPAASTYDLNVEVGSDGTVRVIPPLGGTNSAAH